MYNPGEISKIDDLTLPPWERGVRQKGNMNIDVVKKNVMDMKEIFDRHAFKFVIFFGTLLGARRSGTVIYNDSDFDIMCFAKDYLKWDKVKEDLIKIGFNIPVNKPLMDEYLIRNGEKIDINWMISFGSYYVYDDGIYYPKDYFDTVTTTKLFDMSWPCPSNPDRVLTELYGSDWKIPQAKKGKLAIYPKQ